MHKLIFKDNKKAIRKLAKVQKHIDIFARRHSKKLSKGQHIVLRQLLRKRAKALSKATGMKIYPPF